MRTIALNVMQESIEVAYSTNNNEPPFRQFMITYNPDQAIGDNLEKIKVVLAGLPVDAAILTNSLEYDFSDTVIGINHQRIDIGLALTNMLNIPVVCQRDVEENGLQAATDKKQRYNEWHLDYYGEYEKSVTMVRKPC